MVCHGEHTYLFAQSMMSILAQEEQGGSAVRRIAQEVQRYAHEKWAAAVGSGKCNSPESVNSAGFCSFLITFNQQKENF